MEQVCGFSAVSVLSGHSCFGKLTHIPFQIYSLGPIAHRRSN